MSNELTAPVRLFGADGKALDLSDAARRRASAERRRGSMGRVMQDRPIWDQFQRIGGTLTPTQLSNVIRQADRGDMRMLMDLGNDARQKDGHLLGILSQSEESIAGLDWEFEYPKKSRKKERTAGDWAENHLREKVSEPFHMLIANLAGAVFYGYDVDETIWSRAVDRKGRLAPIDFEHREHRRFKFRESDGQLVWCDPGMPHEGVDFRTQYPNRFVVAQPRVTGDISCREGLIRVMLWAALCRNWTLTDWLRSGEMAWKPWRTAHYDKSTSSDEDIEGLIALLDRLASTGSAAFPKGIELDVKWPQGAGSRSSTHGELFNVLAQEMSKAALGQTETTQSSASTGYAQSKVHYAVRASLLAARARYISFVITRDVIRPMIELNFGIGFPVPKFKLITQEPEDLARFGTGVAALSKAGLRMPSKWLRSKAGMPEPEKDEETIGGAPAADPNDPNAPKEPGEDDTDEGGEREPTATDEKPEDNPGSSDQQE